MSPGHLRPNPNQVLRKIYDKQNKDFKPIQPEKENLNNFQTYKYTAAVGIQEPIADKESNIFNYEKDKPKNLGMEEIIERVPEILPYLEEKFAINNKKPQSVKRLLNLSDYKQSETILTPAETYEKLASEQPFYENLVKSTPNYDNLVTNNDFNQNPYNILKQNINPEFEPYNDNQNENNFMYKTTQDMFSAMTTSMPVMYNGNVLNLNQNDINNLKQNEASNEGGNIQSNNNYNLLPELNAEDVSNLHRSKENIDLIKTIENAKRKQEKQDTIDNIINSFPETLSNSKKNAFLNSVNDRFNEMEEISVTPIIEDKKTEQSVFFSDMVNSDLDDGLNNDLNQVIRILNNKKSSECRKVDDIKKKFLSEMKLFFVKLQGCSCTKNAVDELFKNLHGNC